MTAGDNDDMKPDLHCFFYYIATFLFYLHFLFWGHNFWLSQNMFAPKLYLATIFTFLGVFFFQIKVLEEEKYSLEMKKENGEVPKS